MHMQGCNVWIKDSMENVKIRFKEYEDMGFEKQGDWVRVDDFTYFQLFSWDISGWIELAGDHELVYAYYDEYLNAEFIHIKDGNCLRAYMQYEGEVDTDEGDDPEISITEWEDVAQYIDEHM